MLDEKLGKKMDEKLGNEKLNWKLDNTPDEIDKKLDDMLAMRMVSDKKPLMQVKSCVCCTSSYPSFNQMMAENGISLDLIDKGSDDRKWQLFTLVIGNLYMLVYQVDGKSMCSNNLPILAHSSLVKYLFLTSLSELNGIKA